MSPLWEFEDSDARDGMYNYFHEHDFGEPTDDQREWMELIYEEYADEYGMIDWSDHDMHDSAWYYWMSEVLGMDDETIERYA